MIENPDPFWRLLPPVEFDQGDVFADVPFLLPEYPVEEFEKRTFSKGLLGWASARKAGASGNRFLTHGRTGYGLLLSHGCTLDKGTRRRVTFAYVDRAEDALEAKYQNDLRSQEMANYVFLPGVPGLGDCAADFRVLSTVPHAVLQHQRAAVMTPEARILLEAKLVHFYTRINETWLARNFAEADRAPT